MKKILIISGEGYIGNIISKKLLYAGYHVTSYDNLIYGNSMCVINKIHYQNINSLMVTCQMLKNWKKALDNIDSVVLLAELLGDPITKKCPNDL